MWVTFRCGDFELELKICILDVPRSIPTAALVRKDWESGEREDSLMLAILLTTVCRHCECDRGSGELRSVRGISRRVLRERVSVDQSFNSAQVS
mgnify:CR=1 FL=1